MNTLLVNVQELLSTVSFAFTNSSLTFGSDIDYFAHDKTHEEARELDKIQTFKLDDTRKSQSITITIFLKALVGPILTTKQH